LFSCLRASAAAAAAAAAAAETDARETIDSERECCGQKYRRKLDDLGRNSDGKNYRVGTDYHQRKIKDMHILECKSRFDVCSSSRDSCTAQMECGKLCFQFYMYR